MISTDRARSPSTAPPPPSFTVPYRHDRARISPPPRTAHRSTWSGLALLIACACQAGDASTPNGAPAQSAKRAEPPTAATAAKTSDEARWRYLPAFQATREQLVTGGAAAELLLEVANGRTGRARFLVAAARPGQDPALRLELWSLSQNNAKGLLQRSGEPIVVGRLRPSDPRAPELERLREEIATPGVEKTRLRGLPGENPAKFLEALARARALALKDGPAETRARALAEVVHGVDDPLLLDRDALYRVLEVITDEREWRPADEGATSTRRFRLRSDGPGEAVRIEVLKTRRGWILSDLRRAEPEPDEATADDATANKDEDKDKDNDND